MAYDLTPDTRRALCDLLLQMFDTNGLERFLEGCFDSKFMKEVAKGNSENEFVWSAVKSMEQHGLVGAEFFVSWKRERSNLIGKIAALEDAVQLRGGVGSTSDLKGRIDVVGDPDVYRVICKAAGSDFVKATKAMEVPGGVLIQVSTKERNPDNTVAVAEAVAFVPGVKLSAGDDGKSWKLVAGSQEDAQ